jgi:hypothetical protein
VSCEERRENVTVLVNLNKSVYARVYYYSERSPRYSYFTIVYYSIHATLYRQATLRIDTRVENFINEDGGILKNPNRWVYHPVARVFTESNKTTVPNVIFCVHSFLH